MNAKTSLIFMLWPGWTVGSWHWYICKKRGFHPGAEAPVKAAPDLLPPVAEPKVSKLYRLTVWKLIRMSPVYIW